MLRVLDLFSGIGGFSVGLERTGGFVTIAFCEINLWCRKVLKKHWPSVQLFEDITQISQPMSSLVGFLAKMSATQGNAPEFPVAVPVCGRGYAEPFAWYDLSSQSWRTWQRCLEGGWELYSETWPRSGMTRNGIAYRLPTLAQFTPEIESGLLPTIAAREVKDWSKASILASLDKGNGVAKRICSLSPTLRSSQEICGLNPSFAEWMQDFPIGHTELPRSEMQSFRKSRKSSGGRSSKPKR